MGRMILLAAVALCLATCTQGFTYQSEIDALLKFKAMMEPRGPHWVGNLANWTCPTPAATSNGSCDPCGAMQWWGNWPYMACRGFTIRAFDQLGGNGYVTDIHFTDAHLEGPDLPIQQLCDLGFVHLKELDINGNYDANPPMGGPIPEVYGECFKNLSTSKLSFNRLTGPLPAFIANNKIQSSFKARQNLLTGPIPAEIGAMPILKWLDLSLNQLNGTIPSTFRQSNTMSLFQVSNNNLTGPLYNMPKNLYFVETANNAGLCGMVPASVRWAHGYNPSNTNLGQPCPGESYPLTFPAGF